MRKSSKQRPRSLTSSSGCRTISGSYGLNVHVLELVRCQDKKLPPSHISKEGGRPPLLPGRRGSGNQAVNFLVKNGAVLPRAEAAPLTESPSHGVSQGSTNRSLSVSAALARLAGSETPTSSLQLMQPMRSASPSAQSTGSADSYLGHPGRTSPSSTTGRSSPSALGQVGRVISEVSDTGRTEAEEKPSSRAASSRSPSADVGDTSQTPDSPCALRSSLRSALESKRSSLSSANPGDVRPPPSQKRVAFAKETKDLKKVSLLDMLSATAIQAD
mmetsp:Transcript_29202/g.67219  ORF Transcript_29202/g.67219 Transcript_29202/m.67219 type:complete len:273 (+) Transcript_29202:69-887(+)